MRPGEVEKRVEPAGGGRGEKRVLLNTTHLHNADGTIQVLLRSDSPLIGRSPPN